MLDSYIVHVFDILHSSGLPVNNQIEDTHLGQILIRAGSLMEHGFTHSASHP